MLIGNMYANRQNCHLTANFKSKVNVYAIVYNKKQIAK